MININYVPALGMTETVLFAAFPMAEMISSRSVIVELYFRTKTRLSVSFRHGASTIGVNTIPAGSEQFKFDIETGISYFDGERKTKAYFKVSKKQCLPQLEEHLKNLVKEVCKITDGDEFTINVWENYHLRNLRALSSALVTG